MVDGRSYPAAAAACARDQPNGSLAAGSAPATASAPLRTRESPHRGAAASPRARVIHPTPSNGRAPRPDGNWGRWTSHAGWGQRDKSTRAARHTRAPTWILSVRSDSLATVLVMCDTRKPRRLWPAESVSGDRAAVWPATIGSCRSSTAVSASQMRSRRNAPHPSGSGAFYVGGARREPKHEKPVLRDVDAAI